MSNECSTVSPEEAHQTLTIAAEAERTAHEIRAMPRWITISFCALFAAIVGIFAIPDAAKSWRFNTFFLLTFLQAVLILIWTSRNRGVRLRRFWSKIRPIAIVPCLVIWIADFLAVWYLAGTGWMLLVALVTFVATTAIFLCLDAYEAKHTGVASR